MNTLVYCINRSMLNANVLYDIKEVLHIVFIELVRSLLGQMGHDHIILYYATPQVPKVDRTTLR